MTTAESNATIRFVTATARAPRMATVAATVADEGRRRRLTATLGAALVVAFSFGSASASPEVPFWIAASRVTDTRASQLAAQAGALLAKEKLPEAEERLRAVLALRPTDTETAGALAEVQSSLGRNAAAAETLESALAGAPLGESGELWARLGAVRARLGRYGDAVVAYTTAAATGVGSPDVFVNLGEVLMAGGRLGDAEARYRDALAVASGESTGERRARSQDLALACYGLAVALDRDEKKLAAREMMGRGLAQDPGGALLKVAETPSQDLFFVPEGDVYYYLGLAAEVGGRGTDAEAAFREFLARSPASRWARAATAHVAAADARARSATTGRSGTPAELGGDGSRPPGARQGGARVIAFGTVEALGGLAAPLIDAAWRGQAGLLDACLDRAVGRGSVRFSVALELDGRGQVRRARVKAPPPLDEEFARCVEVAVKQRLRVSAPARAKPTSARTEVIVAFP